MVKVKMWGVSYFNGRATCVNLYETRKRAAAELKAWREKFTPQGWCAFELVSIDKTIPTPEARRAARTRYDRWAVSKGRITAAKRTVRYLNRWIANPTPL